MNDETIIHLLMYLQNMIDSGQHKLFYNDLMHDEKVIDIINAITNLQQENERLNNIVKETRQMLYKRMLDDYDTYTANVVCDFQSDFEEIIRLNGGDK